ncbi:MAG: hypothetical protein JWR74_94 [Polaromonas sp.]|nr:hypothetical protein [Polaromonas sp.]
MQPINKIMKFEQVGSPLVTFALIAYKQEEFIREAVNAALAQEYQPLEIILSDDCSPDRTFEIMKEIVAEYSGPHHVRLNRNISNMGGIRHVFLLASMSNAEYFVLAAGDDISKPSRTAELVRMFEAPNVLGVCSGYDVIDENSVVVQKNCLAPNKNRMGDYFKLEKNKTFQVIQGSTSAYRKEIFFNLASIDAGYAEDNLLNFYIYANGGVVEQTSSSLVLYRQHANAVHHKVKILRSASDSEKQSYEDSQDGAKKIEAFKAILKFSSSTSLVNRGELEKDLKRYKIVCAWPLLNIFERICSIFGEIFLHKSYFLKWQAARIFGKFPKYQPKMLLEDVREKLGAKYEKL